ncbi:MAG: glycosyltransferase [Chryseolinea sp.]
MPRISVCLATYNGERYIAKQLDSILTQLGDDDEVVVSDDSSTDRTVEIVRSYNDSRIKLFPDQKFRSPIFNFENALKHATGQYVFLSDQDDLWHHDKVKTALKSLQSKLIFVSDADIVNENGDMVQPSFFAVNGSARGIVRNILRNSYLGCCLALRQEVLRKALPFPKDIPMHDWWIGIVAEVFYHKQVEFCYQPLISYRRHGNNASPTGSASHYGYYQRFMFRWRLIKGVVQVWSRK